MITYNTENNHFLVMNLFVILEEDVFINWPDKAPHIEILNNHIITLKQNNHGKFRRFKI